MNVEIGTVSEVEVAGIVKAVMVGLVVSVGTVGVTELEAEEATDVPIAFVALTVNVYEVPLVSPVIVIGEVVLVADNPPVDEYTVYEVIALPPFDAGAVNETEAVALPAVAVPIVGAPGTVRTALAV